MLYKQLFSDFDGTLLTSEHKISPKTQAAIERITTKGIPFVPISARSPKALALCRSIGRGFDRSI